jgi:acyl-CoA dehydrogenase
MKAQDTSELFFDNVRVPADHLLGPGHRPGLRAADAAAAAGAAGDRHPGDRRDRGGARAHLAYVKQRKAFGKAIIDFQNTRFKLAELKTKALVARSFVDDCTAQAPRGQARRRDRGDGQVLTTDLQCELIDECLQFFGGYGYMWEYPIARLYADARVQKIYGGTNEIMKN